MVPRTRLFVGNCEAKCMIKIFWGAGVVTPSKPPPPYEQLLPLPTPCFKMFLERSLNDPHPPPPHFKHLSLLPPSPSTTPSPPKNFDHALSEAFAVWNSFCSWAQLGLVWLHSIRCEMDFNDLLSKGLVKFGRVWHLI